MRTIDIVKKEDFFGDWPLSTACGCL